MAARSPSCILAACLAVALAIVAGRARAEPRVVASVAPVHSLVASVMAGLGTPELIVRGAASPHSYALRPSEARALNRANVVFWIGPAYEGFLERPLAALPTKTRLITLMRAAGVALLPLREGGDWGGHDDGHAHGHEHDRQHGAPATAETDGHIFLDPENAKAIVHAAVAALSEADPLNAARYAANGADAIARLDALDGEIRRILAPVHDTPFVVFHDAYQYFERRYGLNAVGAIVASPERPPGARHLQRLRRKITQLKAVCIFAEPQFAPALLETVAAGTPARAAVLDPLGVTLTPGPDAYFELMRGLARSLADCLEG